MPGYHLNDIPKGKIGEISKIEEELAEVKDAFEQDAKIMVLIELSDMLGAIDLFLEKYCPNIRLEDLIKMSNITHRAFSSGARKSG